MKLIEIESDGKKFTFQAIQNYTAPCPQCGVPACGKEDILWLEENEQRIAIVFDGSTFDLAIEVLFRENIAAINYDSLPLFLREWNEARGWSDSWDYEGHELDPDDFLASMELLRTAEMGKWITVDEINSLANLAQKAKKKGGKLKIVRG